MYSNVATSPSPSIIQNVSISDNKLISNVRSKIEIASLDNVSIKNNTMSRAYIYSSKITNNIFKNSGNMSNVTPVNMVCIQFLPTSDLSKYVDISNNTFINTGVFSENSPVVFSVPLNEPLTFSLKNNNFKGFSDKVYMGSDSIYKYVVNSNSFKGYITAPNSVTLNVSGGQMYNFNF